MLISLCVCVCVCVYLSVCVCVCVHLVFITSWGPNVPTRIVIPVNLYLVGTFFGPHEETSL